MNRDLDSKVPMLIKSPPVLDKNGKLGQYLAAITVSIGAFAVGTVLSWTSAALPYVTTPPDESPNPDVTRNDSTSTLSPNPNPQNVSTSTFPNFTISHEQEALVGALLTVGALISAIPSGCLADKFGRKKILLMLSIPFLVNWIFICYANNIAMLLFARLMAGISVGGFCVVAPMYIGEIAEVSYRGTFGSFFQMFLCCGILFTAILGSFTKWLGLALILGSIPIIFFVSFYFMPEAPIYLLKKNKVLEAEKTLKALRGPGCNVIEELNFLQKELHEAADKTVSLKSILRNKGYIKAIISVVGVLAFQQLSGINAIIFYTVPIFESAGSTLSPSIAAIIINLVQVVTSYISIMIIEKADRKFYLMISAVGMFLCLSSLGVYFHFTLLDVKVLGYLRAVPIGSTILFMVAFAVGFGPIPWMLMGELFAPEIKGPASGVAVLANWVFAFLVTFFFPILNVELGPHATFYMFSGFMALAIAFVYFVVPETRGKTLLEIQKDLNE